MVKAYDVKDLVEKMKAAGLPIAEEAAEQVIKSLFAWLKESAAMSPTNYDDLAAFLYPKIEEIILKQIEKIS